ncbi:hypothetical protein T4D_10216 [Trichinella pseudospiralis]|uniref:Uncharacterized protein n=1 Tax=Trichinella pseudospiralis TaxID=6337 RepID=A0A0V1FV90_TRIPS|nr:hypothetical protein T4D_10216 [Trichinella pseudospiralis]
MNTLLQKTFNFSIFTYLMALNFVAKRTDRIDSSSQFERLVARVASIFRFVIFRQIVYILTEFRMSSISNALETVFTATCAVSDFYANKGGFKNSFRNNSARSERCAANERTVAFSVRWQTKNSNKNGFKRRRIEDGREGPEDDGVN